MAAVPIKIPSWTRIERLLAMNLLAICESQRNMSVEEKAELLRRCGIPIREACEIIGTTLGTVRVARGRKRNAEHKQRERGKP